MAIQGLFSLISSKVITGFSGRCTVLAPFSILDTLAAKGFLGRAVPFWEDATLVRMLVGGESGSGRGFRFQFHLPAAYSLGRLSSRVSLHRDDRRASSLCVLGALSHLLVTILGIA